LQKAPGSRQSPFVRALIRVDVSDFQPLGIPIVAAAPHAGWAAQMKPALGN
jgi:hypothetical protein